MPSKVKLKLKGGAAVDPDSKLEDVAHVYKKKNDIYNAVLGVTDIQSGKNSYYKIQVLESDAGNRYVSTGFIWQNKKKKLENVILGQQI
jgi:poly [ADP-ribose] polymerase